jgi:heme a synthase
VATGCATVVADPHDAPHFAARVICGILDAVRDRFTVSPERYRRVAYVALAALTVIVLTGAAVRLTDSGLGCPDWPRCYGKVVPPLSYHAIIEFGNRAISGLVGLAAIAAGLLAYLRRPYRRSLMVLGVLLPLGVVAQAVLGGITVTHDLAPGFVMAHFGLSMLILMAAVALAWCATFEPGERPRSRDRLGVWSVRALLPLGALAIFAGTAATAAGPHAGGSKGQIIHRLHFRGAGTLTWVIHRHATIAALLGVAVVAVWLLHRRRGSDRHVIDALTLAGILLAAQGLVGSVQYELHLPGDMVWIHVMLASITWIVLLWAFAAVGRAESTLT